MVHQSSSQTDEKETMPLTKAKTQLLATTHLPLLFSSTNNLWQFTTVQGYKSMELNPPPNPHWPNLLAMYIMVTTAVTPPQKKKSRNTHQFLHLLLMCSYALRLARVLIGFSFTPMLSGERSSGDTQNGFRGLRGLQFIWLGLYKPYPMRKYSIGISIACGCSSVTTDPQACTCKDTKLGM